MCPLVQRTRCRKRSAANRLRLLKQQTNQTEPQAQGARTCSNRKALQAIYFPATFFQPLTLQQTHPKNKKKTKEAGNVVIISLKPCHPKCFSILIPKSLPSRPKNPSVRLHLGGDVVDNHRSRGLMTVTTASHMLEGDLERFVFLLVTLPTVGFVFLLDMLGWVF